jgi:hypothetical protein
VEFNQMTDNCESETQSASRSLWGCSLAEAFKNMWQKRGLDAAA